ncbi:unnamed protein product [Parascedosporium putredinis]|uniref:ubiquitinyl hydrolase 1 n=1 Tax=Parascedosporium putredinis TaxID=1442378 RepID=A0A9P1GWP0_9PEZI|nr:unnamed protein product [Parascedosporium putredinis]CAI7988389.1 unnamed protein product [Parascedosporium putredinis]
MREVLEENFGGEARPQQTRFEEEIRTRELLRKKQQEKHLYIDVQAVTPKTFREYGSTDIAQFDADPRTDESAPRLHRVKLAVKMDELIVQLAEDVNESPKKLRLWVMVNRQNKTVRPDAPVLDLDQTVEELYHRVNHHKDRALRLWVEVAEEVDAEGNGVFPAYALNGPAGSRSESILLFLKCFDLQTQTLRGVGQIYIGRDKKVDDLTPYILKFMGWGDKVPSDERIFLWEEIKPTMIEPLKPKQSLKAAELQDGDIICFQRLLDPKSDKGVQEQRKLQDDRVTDLRKRTTDFFNTASEYYDFLCNKKTVKFCPHPSRCDENEYPAFELTMSCKATYDLVAERVGLILGVQPTHIRFWTVNSTTSNPKATVKRNPSNNLLAMLNTATYSQLQQNNRMDALFFEVLEISLDELEHKKSVKVTLLSEGTSKEEQFDLLVNKNGTVDDLVEALVKKAKIPGEAEGGRIRIFETSQHRFFRELKRDYPVISMNDYAQVYAERVPDEELQASENSLISVFHFHPDPSRAHSVPFKFLLIEGETFSETKKRLERRTGIKGKPFEKIRFAVIRRSHYKPHYLTDEVANKMGE